MMYAEDEYVNYTKVDDSGDGGYGWGLQGNFSLNSFKMLITFVTWS